MHSKTHRQAERPNRITRHGVTLIETILVITLLAAAGVSGIVLFDGQWTARRSVKQVTIDVAGALTAARNSSINSKAAVRVTRNVKNGRQRLVIVEDTGPYRNGNSSEIDLGAEARISGSPTTIQFAPDGTAGRGLSWKIAQQRVSGEISVAPVSGQVTRTLP